MLDLKTGKFVIDAEKGWEVHPFMTREEFQKSGLFNSEYLIKDPKFSMDDPFFCFKPINMNGCDMCMTIFVGGSHDCVREIELVSEDAYEFYNRPYDENWREAAFDVKKMHDEFLMREVGLNSSNIDSEKYDNDYDTDWGTFSSNICLMHDPDISITISYDNLTEEDKKRLDEIPDDVCWS